MAAVDLEGLNPDQKRAATYGVAAGGAPGGPLLVIAGAGSGKTGALAHRVANLIAHGADPRRILMMTFSRRAAVEMRRRVERIARKTMGAKAEIAVEALSWAGTFHAVGARLLREHAPEIGLDPAFTILDREDAADMMALARQDLGLGRTESRFPAKGTCLAIYSRCVNAECAVEAALAEAFPWCEGWAEALKGLFGAYVEAKQTAGVLDYDDLLLYWRRMLDAPEIAEAVGGRFDHVLVDEFQDTNRLQDGVLKAMKPDGRGVTVVGDDAQAIYGFRAATVRNILDFPGAFSPRAEVVTLERNYRSTAPILDAANAVIAGARERYAKALWTDRRDGARPRIVTVADEDAEARCIAERVLEAREEGVALREQAVLFRTSHHSATLELELSRRDIPFVKFGGLKFLEAAHVKDALAVLRLAENPRDAVAGFRALRLLPGVGAVTARKAVAAMGAAADPMSAIAALPAPKRAGAEWSGFVEALREAAAAPWPTDLERVRQWYEPHLERLHEDARQRREDLLQLERIALGYPSRRQFLTDLALDPPEATSDEAGAPLLDDDYLILSTIHSAKGQEWRAVFVMNAVDGCIPSDMATGRPEEIEEERRLLYVAMTRAKDELALLTPHRFYAHGQRALGDRHVYACRTRFIPDAILDRFETAVWPGGPHDLAAARRAGAERTPRMDLAAGMRAMWK